ncbi:hypothetical protein DFH08DRAFT_960676 [Mycena albidolilacea]|uniref:Uncharacterized protein n=1 Tax=Mycena albidolilacea TaxID=1033008 RepID=A0AAD7ES29_9AGAR|nr:hypothetical protein DFH08DRAFT_960676 [Mycena albidolilacea]
MTNAEGSGSTANLKAQKRAECNEKARLRMARKHAELVLRPAEEQQLAAERSRAYQATYREKFVTPWGYNSLKLSVVDRHRDDLQACEAKRRAALYLKCYGAEAYALYLKAWRQRKCNSAAKRAGSSFDLCDLPYGFGYHPEENDGIIGRTLIPACYFC